MAGKALSYQNHGPGIVWSFLNSNHRSLKCTTLLHCTTGFSTAAYCCLLLSAALALCCYLHAEAIGQLPQLLGEAGMMGCGEG